jgi:hypothetical protein
MLARYLPTMVFRIPQVIPLHELGHVVPVLLPEIDWVWEEVFKVSVCSVCKEKYRHVDGSGSIGSTEYTRGACTFPSWAMGIRV